MTADTGTGRSRSLAWGEARTLLGRQRIPLAVGLGCMVVNRAAALVLPSGSKVVIDEVVGRGRTELLGLLGAAAGVAIVVEAASGYALAQVVGVAAQRALTDLRNELQAHVLRLPVGYFDMTSSGALVSRLMTDPEQLRYVVGPGLVQLASGLLTAAFALGVLFYLNLPLTLVVLALVLVFLVGVTQGFRWLTPAFYQVSERTAELTGRLAEALGAIRVIKVFVAERREAFRFARESHRLLRATIRSMRGVAAYTGASTLVTGVVGVLVLVVGGRAVVTGTMTVGDFVLYVLFAGLLWMPLVQVAAVASELGKGVAALTRIGELRALVTEEAEDRNRLPLGRVEGAIKFDDVSFAYPDGRVALRDISFEAPAGSLTAIVGPSGAGKSTLVQLVAVLREPTSGRVLCDERDLSTLRRRDYRGCLGLMAQESTLFDGTIAENIRYGRPGAAMVDVSQAGRLAHCEEFVSRLPDGYATRVGEHGWRLSAGQRQRVAIARAILADSQILILDEPTAHLDSESEALIQDAFRMLCRGRTTFVIAHRLATVRRADQILVLEHGALVERGTHDELIRCGGRYGRLHAMQVYCERAAVLREVSRAN